MCLRFGDGENCSVKSEELRGKLKSHNGNIMGLVSESRRRARGGRMAAVTLSYLKAALWGLGSQEETTAGPKQALEIHQQHNGCMWLEFLTVSWSEVVSLQACCSSGWLRLAEYPRGSQSTHGKAGPQKSPASFLEGSG